MVFDGRKHNATSFIYPYHHHPRAPHTGIVYGRALSNAYAAAQLGSPIVFSHAASLPFDNPDFLREGELIDSTSVVPLAEGLRRIDGTHLVARVQYILPEVSGETVALHQIKVFGNAITTNGNINTEEVGSREAPGQPRAKNQIAGTLGDEIGYSAFASNRMQKTTIELELDPDQIGHDCRVQVLGCAANRGATEKYNYRLMSIVVFQEFR